MKSLKNLVILFVLATPTSYLMGMMRSAASKSTFLSRQNASRNVTGEGSTLTQKSYSTRMAEAAKNLATQAKKAFITAETAVSNIPNRLSQAFGQKANFPRAWNSAPVQQVGRSGSFQLTNHSSGSLGFTGNFATVRKAPVGQGFTLTPKAGTVDGSALSLKTVRNSGSLQLSNYSTGTSATVRKAPVVESLTSNSIAGTKNGAEISPKTSRNNAPRSSVGKQIADPVIDALIQRGWGQQG